MPVVTSESLALCPKRRGEDNAPPHGDFTAGTLYERAAIGWRIHREMFLRTTVQRLYLMTSGYERFFSLPFLPRKTLPLASSSGTHHPADLDSGLWWRCISAEAHHILLPALPSPSELLCRSRGYENALNFLPPESQPTGSSLLNPSSSSSSPSLSPACLFLPPIQPQNTALSSLLLLLRSTNHSCHSMPRWQV